MYVTPAFPVSSDRPSNPLPQRGSVRPSLHPLRGPAWTRVIFLYFLAANFESGVSGAGLEWVVLGGAGLLVAQLAVLIGCSWVDGKGLVESIAATAAGTFKFWLVFAVVSMVTMNLGG